MWTFYKCKEKMPPPESRVLVAANKFSVFIMYYGLGEEGILKWFYDGVPVRPYMIPTHWAFLPEHPEWEINWIQQEKEREEFRKIYSNENDQQMV